jgi:hypothetical protein
MSNFRKRLADIEEQKAFRDWQEQERLFKGRSRGELMFFSWYGYFPESLEGQPPLPPPRREEFTVGGVTILTVTTVERADKR